MSKSTFIQMVESEIKYTVNGFGLDENYNPIHYRGEDAFEWWKKFDKQGREVHYKDTRGLEWWKTYKGRFVQYNDSYGEEWTREFNKHGTERFYSDSHGLSIWYNDEGEKIRMQLPNEQIIYPNGPDAWVEYAMKKRLSECIAFPHTIGSITFRSREDLEQWVINHQ